MVDRRRGGRPRAFVGNGLLVAAGRRLRGGCDLGACGLRAHHSTHRRGGRRRERRARLALDPAQAASRAADRLQPQRQPRHRRERERRRLEPRRHDPGALSGRAMDGSGTQRHAAGGRRTQGGRGDRQPARRRQGLRSNRRATSNE
ncbi:hypothetical protein VARIO8X_90143 [Burkholderiales bacterium 8X]|nr:hypothetical protein VARIO8X_90143 [Burkholderiales bacterium 8X]